MPKTPTILIDPDETERLRELLPKEEGAFCRGDVIRALELPVGKVDWLISKWRRQGIIVPFGKVERLDAWGDPIRIRAYRFAESEEEGGDNRGS